MYQNAVIGTIQTVPPKTTIFHKYCYDSVLKSTKMKSILPSQLAPGSPIVIINESPNPINGQSKIEYDGDTVEGGETVISKRNLDVRLPNVIPYILC
jgi:hypothetical protein